MSNVKEPKVEIIESSDKHVKLLLEGVPLSLANALRRYAIKEVPTMAAEEILVIDNTSAMTNEILCHRLSLIPFVANIDRYVERSSCDCGSKTGCSKCVVRYSLKVEAKDSVMTVYSRDMVPEDPNTDVKPVSDSIPIVKLAPGQKVELEIYVRVGRGKHHAKWQPGIVTLSKPDDSWPEDKRVLYVETYGSLEPKRIVKEAIRILDLKASEMEKVAKDALQHTSS